MTPSIDTDLYARLPGIAPPTLDWEIRSEQASSLGRAGRRVEAAIAALEGFHGEAAARDALVREAADAVWSYFIQRETMGLRRHDDAIEAYRIPGEVLRRVGC